MNIKDSLNQELDAYAEKESMHYAAFISKGLYCNVHLDTELEPVYIYPSARIICPICEEQQK